MMDMCRRSLLRHLLLLLCPLIIGTKLYAQWTGHFTDSISLSSPPWQGSLTRFSCDAIHGLLLKDLQPKNRANRATLLHPLPIFPQMTWRGAFVCTAPPTVDNNLFIQLYTTPPKANGNFEAMVLECSDKNIVSLMHIEARYTQEGCVQTIHRQRLISYESFLDLYGGGGRIDYLVQYDASAEGVWRLWIYRPNERRYRFVGEDTWLMTEVSESLCGVVCYYSKSRADGFLSIPFIEVSSRLLSPDEVGEAPEGGWPAHEYYLGAEMPDPSHIVLTCAEEPDLRGASIILSPQESQITHQVEGKKIILTLNPPLSGREYLLSLQGVRSLSGRAVEAITFRLQGEETQKEGVPIFSEFMANPLAGATEYLELHNPNSFTIDASQYAVGLVRQGSVRHWYPLSQEPCPIPAGGYHAFAKSIRGITNYYDVPRDSLTQSADLPTLANDGFTIQLLSLQDSVVTEEFYYTPQLLGEGLRSKRGVALERCVGKRDQSSTEQWRAALASSKYATPGQRNSIDYPSATPDPDSTSSAVTRTISPHITEIMARPTVDGSEYIELFNPSDSIIPTELYALQVVQSGHPGRAIPLPSHPQGGIPPGQYVALTPSTYPLERLYSTPIDSLLFFPELPHIPDTSCAIRLVHTSDLSLVEEVYYDQQAYPATLRKRRGVAFERINPYLLPSDLANWSPALASANYATPGRQNSVIDLSGVRIDQSFDPGRYRPLPLDDLARQILRAEQSGKATLTARLYTLRGQIVWLLDHDQTLDLCKQILEHRELSPLLPPVGVHMLLAIRVERKEMAPREYLSHISRIAH